jgi:hypothetical protein
MIEDVRKSVAAETKPIDTRGPKAAPVLTE